MATAALTSPTYGTMAELIDHLGDIPPERIRLQPAPGTATEDFATRDFWYCSCHLPENVRVSRPKRF